MDVSMGLGLLHIPYDGYTSYGGFCQEVMK